tara:strand:+ start:249 stop:521 length:273 start_codon:yes stop_codon:yes gene_type:complete
MSATAVLKWIGGFIMFAGWWLAFDSFIPKFFNQTSCQIGNSPGLSHCSTGVSYMTQGWEIMLILVALALTFAFLMEAMNEAGGFVQGRRR